MSVYRSGARRSLLVIAVVAWAAVSGAEPVFDHAPFDRLLRTHVEGGLVDYDAFQAAPEFGAYLRSLAGFDPSELPDTTRLAFWINAYNAYTIHLINLKGERESIRNINKALGLLKLKGPWEEPIARVGDRTLSLGAIEHEIIRKQFHEPRIHFALVCAALGCPPLRGEAYLGERLDRQLEEQARLFIRHSPEKNRLSVGARVVHLSPIFDWYREDFGGSDAAIGRYLASFYAEGPERQLLLGGDFTLKTTPYDWRLNLR